MVDNILDLIGNTKIVKVEKNIFAKCEFVNPAGSIKDRAVKSLVINSIKTGLINKDTTIIEPTSGNTGIALAMICNYLKIKLIIVMPSSVSKERKKLLKYLGVKLILTKDIPSSVKKAKKLSKKIKNSIILDQFNNYFNLLAHRETAKEIIDDFLPDIFVTSVGTGGTLIGIAKELKKIKPNIKIVAIEPKESAVLSGKKASYHKIQGIGAGFVPGIFDKSLVDDIILVSSKKAIKYTKKLAKKGFLVGFSSGANFYGAKKLAKKYPNKKILTIFVDSIDRYLSSI